VDHDPVPARVYDDQLQQWVSDAEVAEVPFTAFTSNRENTMWRRG
jgi:hypothetical protein